MASVPSLSDGTDPERGALAAPEDFFTGKGPPHSDQTGTFLIRLDQYEGPLDALLDLVKKQRIDILDLPVARITEQYLASIRAAEELDIEVGAEFILMAATLVQIKAKMLLPSPPSVDDEPSKDLREELVRNLLERERFVLAAEMLREKRVIEESVWTAGGRETGVGDEDESPEIDATLYDLVTTFGEMLDRLRNEPVVELEQEEVSVASRIHFLKQVLLAEDEPVSVRKILWQQRSQRALVATFLALLELVKAGAVALRQDEIFGEIVMRKHSRFDEAFEDDSLIGSIEPA